MSFCFSLIRVARVQDGKPSYNVHEKLTARICAREAMEAQVRHKCYNIVLQVGSCVRMARVPACLCWSLASTCYSMAGLAEKVEQMTALEVVQVFVIGYWLTEALQMQSKHH